MKTIPGGLTTACGVKPVEETQWQRGCFWLYGVVEPLTGFSFFYEFSHLEFQPSHSPGLNPVERVWLFLKKHLAWKNCPTLEELRQLLASELDQISPDRITSLTSYDFILEALLVQLHIEVGWQSPGWLGQIFLRNSHGVGVPQKNSCCKFSGDGGCGSAAPPSPENLQEEKICPNQSFRRYIRAERKADNNFDNK